MPEENGRAFRFLTDEEFSSLATPAKAAYLSLAIQELEARQHKLREQLQQVSKEQPKK